MLAALHRKRLAPGFAGSPPLYRIELDNTARANRVKQLHGYFSSVLSVSRWHKSFTGFPQIVFGPDFTLLRDVLRAHTFRALSREGPVAQLWVAEVATAIVCIVEKRNLLNVVALLKVQVESFVGHNVKTA